jgi:hypothetical protein
VLEGAISRLTRAFLTADDGVIAELVAERAALRSELAAHRKARRVSVLDLDARKHPQ